MILHTSGSPTPNVIFGVQSEYFSFYVNRASLSKLFVNFISSRWSVVVGMCDGWRTIECRNKVIYYTNMFRFLKISSSSSSIFGCNSFQLSRMPRMAKLKNNLLSCIITQCTKTSIGKMEWILKDWIYECGWALFLAF